MKFKICLLFFLLIISSVNAQQLKVVNFSELEKEFKNNTDTLKIVNFWATTCGPCIEEMKYFVQAQEAYKNQKVSFIYVSLDFSKQKEKAEQLAQKKGLKGKLFLLKDDPNIYINKIDKNWEGQMPFTLLVLRDGTYITHDSKFNNFEELNNFIKNSLK